MHTSTCENCGKQFDHAARSRRFCSTTCARKAEHAQRKAQPDGYEYRKKGTTVACEVCGAQFYQKPWQAKKGHGRFCGDACKTAWQGRNTVTRPCAWCGALFSDSPSQARRVRFCSWECQVEGRSKTAIDRWHNGRRVRKNSDGYLMVYQPDHPSAYKDGWMLEHRLVAEQTIGRALAQDEHIHHINGMKDDNDPANLLVLSPGEHVVITTAEYRAKQDAERRRIDAELAELAEYRKRFGTLD